MVYVMYFIWLTKSRLKDGSNTTIISIWTKKVANMTCQRRADGSFSIASLATSRIKKGERRSKDSNGPTARSSEWSFSAVCHSFSFLVFLDWSRWRCWWFGSWYGPLRICGDKICGGVLPVCSENVHVSCWFMCQVENNTKMHEQAEPPWDDCLLSRYQCVAQTRYWPHTTTSFTHWWQNSVPSTPR